MKTVVIGGSGHIGTFLIPRLVNAGHEVMVVTRGRRQPYQTNSAWNQVSILTMDRAEIEKTGSFGEVIRDLEPEAVIDLICFNRSSAVQLVEALIGRVRFFAHCGSLWVRSYGAEVPASEEMPRNPISDYGRRKNEIEQYLLNLAQTRGFPATVLHPGHISAAGWTPVGPTASHDPEALLRCIRGEELILPNHGMETVHHVHADDVAQAFQKALERPSHAIGEAFFIGAPHAMTLRGLAEGLAARFGVKANLSFLPADEWIKTVPEAWREDAESHLHHSTCASIQKAKDELAYCPGYSSLDAVEESVRWMLAHPPA